MGVDKSAVARVLGIETKFQPAAGGGTFLPMRIYVVGQGATGATYSLDKFRATSHAAVGDRVGYGSPLHRVARRLFPDSGDGVGSIPVTFAPLLDDSAGQEAIGLIVPTGDAQGRGSLSLVVSNTRTPPIPVEDSEPIQVICQKIVQAVNEVLEIPVRAQLANEGVAVALLAKWRGPTGNAIHVDIESNISGVTFAITQPSGGEDGPAPNAVTAALARMGNVWETLVLNCQDIEASGVLDAIQEHGEGRWGTLVRKPYVAFTGSTVTAAVDAIGVSDQRRADRINCQLVAPGSKDLPFDVAARQLARIARVANNNPPKDYGSQKATGLVPGPDEHQWDYVERDLAVKGGSSTIEVKDGVVNIADVVTFHHPTGVPTPPYRYVVDIIKVMNALFNLDVAFSREEWDGAPMIEDDQATENPAAKTPAMAKGVVFGILDFLALQAIISDPDAAKARCEASISTQNPKRLNLRVPIKISGNTNIISADLLWGFHFGQSVAA